MTHLNRTVKSHHRTHRTRWMFCVLCVLCGHSSAWAAERLTVAPVLEHPWEVVDTTARPALIAPLAAAPQLDGELNDPCWTKAPKITSFARLGGVPADAARWVSVQASYDEEHLYLAARLAKPGGAGELLRATITQQGGRIWADDALEIFLFDRQDGVRYQIDVNALGAWWSGSAVSWKPELRTAARIDERSWTVELALPWRDLNFASPGQRSLGVQFRYLVNGQSGSVSWMDAETEQTGAFGDLTLLAADGAGGDTAGRLRVARYFQQAELPVGKSPGSAGVELFNPTKTPLSANIRLSHVTFTATPRLKAGSTGSLDSQTTVEVPPGERRSILMDGVMPQTEVGIIRQTLTVRMADPKTGRPGERLFQRTSDVGTLADLRMQLQRERFHHGEKQVRGTLAIGLAEEAFASASLHVELGTRRRVLSETSYDRIPSRALALHFDLAGLEPGTYQVVASLRVGERVLERMMPIVIEQAMAIPTRQRIPIRVNWPDGADMGGKAPTRSAPLYAGLSFPGGTLLNLDHVRVVNGQGAEVPSQIEAMAHWGPGSSIRWAGAHFIGEPKADYFVEFGSEVKRVPHQGPAIRVERTGQSLRIDTGAAKFDVPRTGALLGDAWLGDRKALAGGTACLIVADQQGHIATELGGPREETPVIETEGPIHVVIRREGFLRRDDGSTLGKYIVRMFFHVGMPFVRVQHSFINTEDTMSVQYSDVALRVKPAFDGPWRARVDHSPTPDDKAYEVQLDPTRSEAVSMTQSVYRHHGQHEQKFTISVHGNGQSRDVETGDACGQWASVTGKNVGVAITLRNFVETFPSELDVSPDGLAAHFWSSRGGRLLDYRPSTLVYYYDREWFDHSSRRPGSEWKGGADGMAALRVSAAGSARTHDLSIHLFAGEEGHDAVPNIAQFTHDPPLALQDPAWLRTTEAMGPLHPHDPERFPRAERFIESYFRYHLVGQAEHWGNYGFLDHGSGPHAFTFGSQDYMEQSYPLLKRTFQFDYKFRSTPWRMYARSGDRMYFAYGDAKNRHLADFRWAHYPARGMKLGAMIMSETAYNLPLYWAGHENLGFQGQDIDNFIYQYYLTGDRWVHETVSCFGEYMAEHFDPRTTKPAGDMYNYQPYMFLASLYEMTWDERIGDKLRAMRWTLDPDTSTGFMDWRTMGAWYKWYIEIFGPLRDFMVTGSREARDAFLKAARLYITYAPAGRHMDGHDMGYDDNYGLAMNLAWKLTGDDRFAAHARETFSRRLFWHSEESGQTHRVGPYTSAHSPQGLDSLAFLMDMVARIPDTIPPFPAVGMGRGSNSVDVYFLKEPNRTARFGLRCGGDFDVNLTQLLDPADAKQRIGSFELNTRPTYSASDPTKGLHAGSRYAELVIPKEAMPGHYCLRNVSEVAWAEVGKMVVVAPAPEGLLLPAESDTPATWYFMLPAGKRGAIHVDQPVILERAGQRSELAADAWHEFEGGPEDQLLSITPARRGFEPLPFRKGRGYTVMTNIVKAAVALKFRGEIPPMLAQHDPDRFFLPHIISASGNKTVAHDNEADTNRDD